MSTTTTYLVDGMTCGHCASAVSSELRALSGVADVQVELDGEGTSRVVVVSDEALAEPSVSAAIDEAGDYRLIGVAG